MTYLWVSSARNHTWFWVSAASPILHLLTKFIRFYQVSVKHDVLSVQQVAGTQVKVEEIAEVN